jgi:hypothetical protein
VPRRSIPAVWSAAWLVASGWATSVAAVPPSETLLPETTTAFVSITNLPDLVDHFKRTEFGQLLNDPVMDPFRKDLGRQFEDRWSGVREKLGITLDDLRGVTGGELAAASIQPAPGKAAAALLVDVTGNLPKATELLKKIAERLKKIGAEAKPQSVGETAVMVFELPKKEPDDPQRKAIYFLKDDLLGVSDSLEVIEKILARLSGEEKDADGSLAGLEEFGAVMDRCRKGDPDAAPQLRWFVQPFGYAEIFRAAIAAGGSRADGTILKILREQGFEAIRGAGGFVDLAVEVGGQKYDLLHREAVFAPQPHERAMKMFAFPNRDQFTPQPWVPRDVATYSTGYVDPEAVFDNFSFLFDAMFADEETKTGFWDDVLEGLESDPNGPQINVRKALIENLGTRLTMITDYELPITTTSERFVLALEVKDDRAVADALKRMFEPDSLGPRPSKRIRSFEDDVIIWETIPPEKPKIPTIQFNALPPLGAEEEFVAADEAPPLLPNGATTVTQGHLFVASHLDFLVEVLKHRAAERETLGGSVDFKFVEATAGALGAGEDCFRVFSRTDEEYRPTYELIRQGKMPESETILGRVLNTVFGVGQDDSPRKQELDGSQLPEFEVIRRHLGLAGGFGRSEETGWFFEGFMISKQ